MKTSSLILLILVPTFSLLSGCATPTDKASNQSTPNAAVATDDAVIDLKMADVQPVPRFRAPPKYPFNLKKAGINGEVLLTFIVDKTGTPTAIQALKASDPAFIEPAIEALQKWRFRPGEKNGHPVACRMQIPFIFSISPR